MPINYKEYPENWKEISEFIRFERAGNRCETCGAENYKPHPVTGSKVILTVAHINHKKLDVRHNRLQYDPNDEENNLVAECQRCHLTRDKKIHARNRKYGRQHNRKEQINLFK
jgi:5-methylcytosine-specific restriction endonuclease McrA